MSKYPLLKQQLIHRGICEESQFINIGKMDWLQVEKVHTKSYLQALQNLSLSKSQIRTLGFPLTTSLVERELFIVEGTKKCGEWALDVGLAFNIAGGTHHAFADHGEGFCVLNDLALCAKFLIESHHLASICILDLDVHQGNGTASIFKGSSKVFTISMHARNNYPHTKEVSHWDISLEDGCGDEMYLERLDEILKRIERDLKPQIILYQAGVDVLKSDSMGKLSLTLEGCKQRDSAVFNCCYKNNIPIVVTMGGGYSSLPLILEAHTATFQAAKDLYC